MWQGALLLSAAVQLATASSSRSGWQAGKFKSLVAFGDSYTDDSRLSYFINHNGSAPPAGWVDPPNYASADGGRPWPQYVHQYAGLNIYNYAVSGAVCSNEITPRYFSAIHADFPDVAGYEVPAYLADKQVEVNGTSFLNVAPSSTVYSIWIGTNDLGNDAFITDSQVAGTNITSYTDCVYDQLTTLYESGARYFVLFNIAPLYLNPQYGLPDAGGLNATQYWPDKPANITLESYRMLEQVETVNDIYEYRTPVDVVIDKKYPGANFAVYDVNRLITNIYNNPSQYLNGTGTLSVTTAENDCTPAGVCVRDTAHPDSYLWYDALHPSEQTDRIIAREFVNVLGGNSSYATYWKQ